MKSLVIYSSQTGNTKKNAEAIFYALPEPKAIHAVEEKPERVLKFYRKYHLEN